VLRDFIDGHKPGQSWIRTWPRIPTSTASQNSSRRSREPGGHVVEPYALGQNGPRLYAVCQCSRHGSVTVRDYRPAVIEIAFWSDIPTAWSVCCITEGGVEVIIPLITTLYGSALALLNRLKGASRYNYTNSGHYPSSCPLFKIQRLGDWILSPSSGATCSVESNRSSNCLRALGPETLDLSVGPNWVRSTLRRRQNPVSETLF
jgi:hypothetical protein